MNINSTKRPKGIFILDKQPFEEIYGEEHLETISNLIDVIHPPITTEQITKNVHLLHDIEILITGWGGPSLDDSFLNQAPFLKLVLYGAGSIRPIVTETFWNHSIDIVSAWSANAVPVSEYTLATILFSLKSGWRMIKLTKEIKDFPLQKNIPGIYKSKIGIIGLGMIGKMVMEKVRQFDVNVIVYDPTLSKQKEIYSNVQVTDSLDELFSTCNCITLHAPNLPQTFHMIKKGHFQQMPKDATFINTARGAIIDQQGLIEVLIERPDLYAVLDVTDPEPPSPKSLLYSLPNCILTPHIAGSQGLECRRMGALIIDELKRFLAKEPLHWKITKAQFASMA